MPAGIALFDYDGDGLLDMYLVNGAETVAGEKWSEVLQPLVPQ